MRLATHNGHFYGYSPRSAQTSQIRPSRSRPQTQGKIGTAETAAEAQLGSPATARRIALYSHDAMGLGHMRRNLLIAQTLANSPNNTTVLVITGAGEANAFQTMPGIDFLTLPALRKAGNGRYESRSLDLELDQMLELRSQILQASLDAFSPDALIVDKLPRGIGHELDAALEHLKRKHRTRLVLGLRDVLDDPETVRREWARDESEAAIHRHYDALWVYGDPEVYDMMVEYRLPPALAHKVRYTGYLDGRQRLGASPSECDDLLASLDLPEARLMLCMVGGGQDGAHIAEAFAQSEIPQDAVGVLVTGPYMPADSRERLYMLAAERPRLRVLEFLSETVHLLQCADRVVAMGGYNTTSEVLSFGKPALIVPRVEPRLEQWIRAERLRDLGLLDVLHPDALSPQAISDWLARDSRQLPIPRSHIDFGGLDRLPRLLEELLSETPRAVRGNYYQGGTWCVLH